MEFPALTVLDAENAKGVFKCYTGMAWYGDMPQCFSNKLFGPMAGNLAEIHA